ncbi:MAG: hypothetical protein IJ207_11565 [Treponema sp.]|uniref:hypothetical protein n=1 Tax=Treponema sp. TaxID=166 RepID=UPI0026002EAD|nr:hypothetical protein [Treponema sp.]MBQ9282812.1 hypothetical protein [Treponema sp.]
MKKLTAFLAAGFLLACSIFAEAPSYDDPNAYVIDTAELSGEMKNNVEVTNVSTSNNFEVVIYGWHEVRKEWLEFGKTRLYGIGDKQTIKPVDKYNRALSSFRYVAIVTSAGKTFKYSSGKAKNDLHIWFYDDREIDDSHNKKYDTSLFSVSFSGLKIAAGKNFKIGASFRIEAYDDEDEEYKAGTIAILKGPKSSDTYSVTTEGKKFGEYKYIKIISREEKDYKYTTSFERNNLVITVDE